MEQLNAVTLKTALWETLHKIKSNEMEAAKGDAIAAQAREILRTIKTQVMILDKAHATVTSELMSFAYCPEHKDEKSS